MTRENHEIVLRNLQEIALKARGLEHVNNWRAFEAVIKPQVAAALRAFKHLRKWQHLVYSRHSPHSQQVRVLRGKYSQKIFSYARYFLLCCSQP
jgi:hypothetical protein